MADEHGDALRYDFRARLGLSWDRAGVDFSWGEAVAFVNRLRLDMGSHLFAALAGWAWPASYGELVGALHYAAFLAVNTDEKKGSAPTVPFPWSASGAGEVVSAEERRVAEENLAARSAIRA